MQPGMIADGERQERQCDQGPAMVPNKLSTIHVLGLRAKVYHVRGNGSAQRINRVSTPQIGGPLQLAIGLKPMQAVNGRRRRLKKEAQPEVILQAVPPKS